MQRFGVDDLRAFDMLRRLSQEQNIKLNELAQRVIDTRGN
jgi:AmiR/NasT family two-component response regulator